MPPLLNIAGQRYGQLTVVERAGHDKYRRVLWRCKCDCGGTTTVPTLRLRSGMTKSCGCLRHKRERTSGKCGFKDETGHRYGKLIVLRRGQNIGKQVAWLCRCDCGAETLVGGTTLRAGNTKSCGCGRGDGGRLPFGRAAFNKLWSIYRCSARARGLEWQLSKERFRELTKQPCFYCGAPPTKLLAVSKGRFNGNYEHNGIDRRDGTNEYRPDNSVPCCSQCNYAKRRLDFESFRAWIARAYHHLYGDVQCLASCQ